MEPILSINIFKSFAQIIQNGFNKKVIKTVSLESIRDVFSVNTIETPLLPLGVISYAENGPNINVLTCREVGVLEMDVSGVMKRFHVPYVYFFWKLRKNGESISIVNSHIRVSFDYPNVNTNLYIPNLPNVHSIGSICWGGNSTFVNKNFSSNDLSHIKQAENVFYIGTHNHHLTSPGIINELHNVIYDTEDEWSASEITKNITPINILNFIREHYENK